MTPLKPGRYWYTTLLVPEGVTVETVTAPYGGGVRFAFTSPSQARQLAARLFALAHEMESGGGIPDGAEPPEVPARLLGLGGLGGDGK